jgi:hypothetical protein
VKISFKFQAATYLQHPHVKQSTTLAKQSATAKNTIGLEFAKNLKPLKQNRHTSDNTLQAVSDHPNNRHDGVANAFKNPFYAGANDADKRKRSSG